MPDYNDFIPRRLHEDELRRLRVGSNLSSGLWNNNKPQPFDSHDDDFPSVSLDLRLSRSHYFDGKLLLAEDLLRDQRYTDERLRQMGRVLGAGIINGLETELVDNNTRIKVAPGIAITAGGWVLELDETLDIQITDAALRQAVNHGNAGHLNKGIYLVALKYVSVVSPDDVEETSSSDLQTINNLEPDAFDEGVELVLVSTSYVTSHSSSLYEKSSLTQRFLSHGTEFPELPDDAIALAVIAINKQTPEWIDNALVRRYLQDEQKENVFHLRLMHHYESLLTEIENEYINTGFPLSRFFSQIPAFGRLPKAMLNVQDARIEGFPNDYQVEVCQVRESELAAIKADALLNAPIDLRSNEAEEIIILVPVSSDTFPTVPLPSRVLQPGSLPTHSINSLRMIDRFSNRLIIPSLGNIAHDAEHNHLLQSLKGIIDQSEAIYYVRKQSQAASDAEYVLNIQNGFPAAASDTTGTTTEPIPSQPTSIKRLQGRGTRDERTIEARSRVLEKLNKEEQHKTLSKLFEHIDNAYDRFMWFTLHFLIEQFSPDDVMEIVNEMIIMLSDNVDIQEIINNLHTTDRIKNEHLDLWKKLNSVLKQGVF